jgi:hypothetical protein
MAASATYPECRIFQWIEKKEPDFADFISQLCLEGTLAPRSGDGSGITFLCPTTQNQKEIMKLAQSDKGADQQKAITMFLACVVPGCYKTAANFVSGQPLLGNKAKVLLGKATANGAAVSFSTDDNTFEIKPAEGFKPITRDKNGPILAIWQVTKGHPPTTGVAYQLPRRRGVEGGAPGAAAPAGPPVEAIMRAELAGRLAGQFAAGCASKQTDPYLVTMTCILQMIRDSHPALFEKIAWFMDYDPAVCFYLLVEPHKMPSMSGDESSGFLIPYGVLVSNDRFTFDTTTVDTSQCSGQFKKLQTEAAECRLRSCPDGVCAQLPQFRSIVAAFQEDLAQQAPALVPGMLTDQYQTVVATNTITAPAGQSMTGLFPEVFLGALRDQPNKYLWQCLVRLEIHAKFEVFRAAGMVFQPAEFEQFVVGIATKHPGNDYVKEACMTPEAFARSVNCRLEFGSLLSFVHSSCFFYVPVSPADATAAAGSAPLTPLSQLTPGSAYDHNAVAWRRLSVVGGAAGVSTRTAKVIAYLKANRASVPEVLKALGMA